MFYFGAVLFVIYFIFKFMYIYYPLKVNKPQKDNRINSYKSFAIIVPAYNEERVILNCVLSLVQLNYPDYKVFLINDGSNDKTFDLLNDFLCLKPTILMEDANLSYEKITGKFESAEFPNIFVINKENGGKADALNAGISCCREEIIITLDADCILRKNAVSVMNEAFQNEKIIAAGGTVHITQNISRPCKDCRTNNIVRYQVLQYLTAFYMHKFTQSLFDAMIVISGAFGAIKRNLLVEIKGYRKTVGEDMDITLKIHKYIRMHGNRHNMAYVPGSICFTECPERFSSLLKQRIRWQKSFIDCLINYGLKMFVQFNTGLSLFFLFDSFLLGTFTSLIFFLVPLYIILENGVSMIFIIFVSADFLFGVIEGFSALTIAGRYHFHFSVKDKIKMSLFIPVQLISYRFLNILFIIIGTISYFFGKNVWNKVERKGRYLYSKQLH